MESTENSHSGSTEMYSEFDYEDLKQKENLTKKRIERILFYLNVRKKKLGKKFKKKEKC